MSTETKRTADEIAENIDAIRQRMDTTLEEIEDRLQPGAWLRNGLSAIGRIDKSRYLIPLATLARRHPTPALAAGIALVGLGIVRQRQANSKIEKEKASLRRLSRAVDAAKGAIVDATDTASSATKQTRAAVVDEIANVSERSRAFARRTGKRINESREDAMALARKHPVITSSAAIAIGIAAVIAIPYLGRPRD
jgi:hypothetical protein